MGPEALALGRGRAQRGPAASRACITPLAYNVEHASHHPSPPHASPLLVVRRRVRHRPSSGPSSPVLQPRLPPTRLRTPPRFRASAHGAASSGPGQRRCLVGHRLRARRLDRSIRQDPRPAHQRAARGPAARNALRPAWRRRSPASTSPRCILGPAAPARLSPIQSPALRNQRVERTRPTAFAARRHRRTADPTGHSAQLDSGEFSVTGSTSTFSATSLHEHVLAVEPHLGDALADVVERPMRARPCAAGCC